MGQMVKDRLKLFIAHLNVTNQAFEGTCGLSNGYVANMRKGVGERALEQISKSFPELNTTWLLTGEGQMLKESEKKNAPPLAGGDTEAMRVKISPHNEDTTFQSSDYMEINQLLSAVLQHGEELRKQGERLDRILALTTPATAAVFAPSSQETERNSPPRTLDRRVNEL